ncbi:MAG: tetratricopeptide repeat protein, partial [Chromatiales bacterium]|nr:tetratricopeptide repeat protein [Chromatiales bacterium]
MNDARLASAQGRAAALATAKADHAAGRIDAAVQMYRALLARDPRQVEALHLLGIAALQQGRPQEAVDLFGRVLALAPGLAVAHSNLGNALKALGRRVEAEASYRRALAIQPD